MEEMMQAILKYLKEKYTPLSVIVYGSYRDGTIGEHSDFDALVVAPHSQIHDVSFVDGVQLDVFVYPASALREDADLDAMVPIWDGEVVLDTDGIGAGLKERVREYVAAMPGRSAEEIRSDIVWCRKMCLRARRGDAEGLYRMHWLLTDSLSIFCDALHQPYFGPKKSLKWMEQEWPEAFALYRNALARADKGAVDAWVGYLEEIAVRLT